MTFSVKHRASHLHDLERYNFDLLVIGGGITGCGIALDAASRGLRVALLEKNDFAYGTSSRSTKLIHGGLRYLKQLEFGLVKEVGSERAVVHNLAPHLVVPEKMLLPLYEKKGLGYWLTSIGLKIYDWLAGVKPEDQRKMLTRSQTLKAEPLLKSDDVKGGAIYAEYRTDDARLTIGIAKAAVNFNATLVNYVLVENFVSDGEKLNGVQAIDVLTNTKLIVKAKVIVNAGGPWVDELRKADDSLKGKRLHLTKGVHIVVAHNRLPVSQAIYFDVEDGRMIFAIPRGRVTYIGTTDTNYTDTIDEVATSLDDARYLVRAANHTFPSANLTLEDIESSWAGLRPLIHEEGKSASELSRKDEIFESPSGLISIAGGKLTGYRKMSERVVNLVIKKHFPQQQLKAPYTVNIKLDRNGFSDIKEVKDFVKGLKSSFDLSFIPEYVIGSLVENFGVNAKAILQEWALNRDEDDREYVLLKSQLNYCIENEMVATLADFFVRRTGLLYFDIRTVLRYRDKVANEMQHIFRWDEARKANELAKLQSLINTAQLKTGL